MFKSQTFTRPASLALAGLLFLFGGVFARANQTATVATGSSVTFSVTVDGTAPFTYQWQKDGANISSAIASTYNIVSAQATNSGNYTVVVSNSAGSTTSDIGMLTVMNLAFTTQPTSQTVGTGAGVTFTAAASGSPTPTYQWQLNGLNVSGATNASLTLSNVQSANAGTYTVVATNTSGSITSNGAVLTVQAATAPVFTTQPSSQSVTTGTSVTFTSAAGGSPVPTFQWSLNGSTLTGATSASLTVAGALLSDAGNYSVVATNSAGSVTSNQATLTVSVAASAPSITTQPLSQTVTAGANVTFTAAAGGSPTPTYQWQKGGKNISGAISASLALTGVQSADAGSYTFVATNSAGTATSSAATLTVNPAGTTPVITTQPLSQTVVIGASVTLTAAASGSPAPSYQWKKNGIAITGATSSTLANLSAQASDAATYSVVATNTAGSVTSSGAALTVVAAVVPFITTQPASQTVAPGANVTFTAAASGTPTPTFQWQKNLANIAGATGATLSLSNVQAGDAGSYTAVAVNSAGTASSSAATLTVSVTATAPAITTQPTSQTVAPGASATFSVAASGTPAPTYQWQKGGVNLAGATSATYTIASVVAGDAGNYTAVATNSAGSATSSAATLTVSAAMTAPLITSQPASLTVTAGYPASFTVTASGNPVPTFQWQKGGVNIAGATSATYTITSVVAGDAGNYTAVATNSAGNATSSAATLTVSAATTVPAITSQPVNQTVTAGGSGSFSVTASGNPAPTYQWYFGGAAISGANSATLSLSNVQAANAGDYYVNVSNSAGSVISTTAKLTVQTQAQAPVISLSSQIVTTGHDVAISASGTGGGVQWQVSTDGFSWTNLANNGTYSGVSSGILEVLGVTSGMNGNMFRCIVSGSSPVSASAATTLTVAPVYFPFPTGVGGDGAGNLYVSDASAQTVQKISSAFLVTLVAGSAGQSGSADGSGSTARFNQPGALAVATDGSLSVSDTANDLIRSITASGAVTTLAGTAASAGAVDATGTAAKFSLPIGIARDASGVLFVADSLNHTIRKITAAGVVTTFAGSAGTAGSTDGNGANARFNNPAGVAVDSSGNVYVADAANNTIRKITSAGNVTTLAGFAGISGSSDGTGSGARFSNPGGLALSSAGDLYLADTGNSTIRKITPGGVVTTVAGLAGIPGLMDGTGGNSWFDQPEGVTLGLDGNLYVADTGNAAIRKVTLTGAVTTVALTAGTSSGSSSSTIATPAQTSSSATSAASSGGGGGGGGALNGWFALALGLICLARRSLKKN